MDKKNNLKNGREDNARTTPENQDEKTLPREAPQPELIDSAEVMLPSVSLEELKGLKEKAAKSDEYYNQILRLQAEFDNARRRWEKDRVEFAKYACEDVVVNLLNIIDNLERAIELAESKHEDFQAFLKGVEMTFSQLLEMLKKYGLAKLDAKGKQFDPNTMEALMQQEDTGLQEGAVVEVLQKGYTLNNKVIRTAKVKVSKRPQ